MKLPSVRSSLTAAGTVGPVAVFSGRGPDDQLSGSPAPEAVSDAGRSPVDLEFEGFPWKHSVTEPALCACDWAEPAQERPEDFRLGFPSPGAGGAGNIRVLPSPPS